MAPIKILHNHDIHCASSLPSRTMLQPFLMRRNELPVGLQNLPGHWCCDQDAVHAVLDLFLTRWHVQHPADLADITPDTESPSNDHQLHAPWDIRCECHFNSYNGTDNGQLSEIGWLVDHTTMVIIYELIISTTLTKCGGRIARRWVSPVGDWKFGSLSRHINDL